MTELWLQLIWKINNILYFDKLNSFMPPSLLSRRQIIFRPNWQIQSKPITFILPWVIKEQILLGNTQSNSSSLFQSLFTISSFLSELPVQFSMLPFFLSFCFIFIFFICNKENRKDGSSAAVAERLWRCMVYSFPFLCGFMHLMSSCLPVLSPVLMANDADYLMEHFRVPKLSAGQLLLLSRVGNSLWNATFSLFPDLFCVSSKLVQLSATMRCLQWAY